MKFHLRIGIPTLCVFLSLCVDVAFADQPLTLTKTLVDQFNDAWNRNSAADMESLLAPTAFFKSPFQLRYGRDEMLATVLARNPVYYRELQTDEKHSLVKGDMAWSIGDMAWRVYDESGEPTEKKMHADYTFIFSRDTTGVWSLEAMIFHE